MLALSSFRWQLLLFAASFSIALLFVVAFSSSFSGISRQLFDRPRMEVRYSLSRKLLSQGATVNTSTTTTSTTTNPNRIGDGCSSGDIVIYQSATAPLPNGIPTYTVHVLNECISGSGCLIGRIHLSCRWFSSARLINPRIFRRLRYDDCLVNDGRPIAAGQTVSFQYANSFPFPMSVSSADCLT